MKIRKKFSLLSYVCFIFVLAFALGYVLHRQQSALTGNTIDAGSFSAQSFWLGDDVRMFSFARLYVITPKRAVTVSIDGQSLIGSSREFRLLIVGINKNEGCDVQVSIWYEGIRTEHFGWSKKFSRYLIGSTLVDTPSTSPPNPHIQGLEIVLGG